MAVCEDPNLSLRFVGQRFPALVFDLDKLPVLSRAKFKNRIYTLATFIEFSAVHPKGPAGKGT